MSTNASVFNVQDDSLDQKQQTSRFMFRVMPYSPLIIMAILIALACSWLYLRYATRTYATRARIIVNDDSQQKNSNLLEIMQLDTRNLSAETEKEMLILSSRDLLSKLVSKMQLNVLYSQKGLVKSGQFYENVPFSVELQQPDSVESSIRAEVEVFEHKIKFDGNMYPLDSFVDSKWGKICWRKQNAYKTSPGNDPWFVTIEPVSSAVNRIKGALTIKPLSRQSAILDLFYIDALPERGENILNNLIILYGTTSVDYKSRISANTLRFLDDRLNLVSQELSGVEKNLQTFKSQQNIVDLGAEGTMFLSLSKETDAKIGELDVQLDVIQKIGQYVTRRNSTPSPIPATLGISDGVLNSLLTQLYETEFELEKIKQVSGSKNPQIAVLEEDIAKLKPSITTSLNNLRLSMLASRESLQQENNRFSASLNKIPQKERLLLDISRQQSIKNAIYTFLLQKREESAIAAAAILSNYRVIEKPEFAGMVAPVAQKIYGIGILIALILIVIYIYFKEFSSNNLLFRSQIESRLSVPIIAELSYQPNEDGSPVVVGLDNRSLIGEQFRELRTNLYYATALSPEKCKVILITSSIPGEGKSFVTINTAVSLSLTGARVILLELDLRKPKISKEMGITRDPGFSNYLINRASEKDIIKPHPSIANFSVIPSGPIPPNPSELLSSPRLIELMDYLKQHFDYIIIDTPPVGSVTDAKILAPVAHVTLYIIRHNYTNSSFLQLISDVQQKNALPNLNIIFNGITTKKIMGYSYNQGYGYGYGGGYGYGYTEDGMKKSWWTRILQKKKKS